jgi:hypothetical protein
MRNTKSAGLYRLHQVKTPPPPSQGRALLLYRLNQLTLGQQLTKIEAYTSHALLTPSFFKVKLNIYVNEAVR